MSETRKLTTIVAADVAGYSRLTAADEERTVLRLRALRGDLIDPAINAHHGRIVKRTGDGTLMEFRSVVDAVRCSIEVQSGMVERNAGLRPERQILFRIGIHLGDVIEEADGDLMGDGVNIAARVENICEPGAICLSEHAYLQVKSRLDIAVSDLGAKDLKNIPEPVHVYSLEIGKPPQAKPAKPTPRSSASTAPRLSIVVLPFANMGDDPEQEYFVDGVTESLTTDLSRISGSFVIGRHTAFTYKGKAIDLKQIGRELNVRYVLEGSVQRGGNRMRVNVQLIDAETENYLWAERFDKPLADLFDMQDEIVARLANQLGTELVAAEARRAERASHADAMDLYFQGMVWVNKGFNPDHFTRARGFFERASALDASNVEALVGAAFVDAVGSFAYMADDRVVRLVAAEAALAKALSLAPKHALAHCLLGVVQIQAKRGAQGIAECERALALDRNLAMAHGLIGFAKFVLGRAEDTAAHVEEALRLSPRDVYTYVWLVWDGVAKLALGADEAAAARFSRSVEINRNLPIAHFMLAAALAHLGRLDEARDASQTGLALDSTFTIRRFRAGTLSDHPVYLAQRERTNEGMRKAGVPEG